MLIHAWDFSDSPANLIPDHSREIQGLKMKGRKRTEHGKHPHTTHYEYPIMRARAALKPENGQEMVLTQTMHSYCKKSFEGWRRKVSAAS